MHSSLDRIIFNIKEELQNEYKKPESKCDVEGVG